MPDTISALPGAALADPVGPHHPEGVKAAHKGCVIGCHGRPHQLVEVIDEPLLGGPREVGGYHLSKLIHRRASMVGSLHAVTHRY